MIPAFDKDGNLPSGIHWATWNEVVGRFGGTAHRDRLLNGLLSAMRALGAAGCQTVFLDGSFVTSKQAPNDFDACWDIEGVDPLLLDPALLDFTGHRAAQKAKYLGELFPAQFKESGSGSPFFEFFQTDRHTGNRKGIVAIDLAALTTTRKGVP